MYHLLYHTERFIRIKSSLAQVSPRFVGQINKRRGRDLVAPGGVQHASFINVCGGRRSGSFLFLELLL